MPLKKHFEIIFLTAGIMFFCLQTSRANGVALHPDSSVISFAPKTIACASIDAVDTIIWEAINIGAPTYNQGNYLGCYRIYEGASYKIIYLHASVCPRVSEILKTALEKSYSAFTDSEKAWIMRAAFDQILGVPTKTK